MKILANRGFNLKHYPTLTVLTFPWFFCLWDIVVFLRILNYAIQQSPIVPVSLRPRF